MYSINLYGGRRRRQKRIDDVGSVASAALLSFSSFVKVDTEDLSLAHIHSRGNEDVLRQKDKKQRERDGEKDLAKINESSDAKENYERYYLYFLLSQ